MMDKIEVYACYTVKIYKYKPLKNFKRGRVPGAPVLDPPLLQYKFIITLFIQTSIRRVTATDITCLNNITSWNHWAYLD